MSDQPARISRLKRVLYTTITTVAIITIFIGLKIYNRIQLQATIRPKVIAAVRADFPDFCTNGEISADPAILYSNNVLFANYDPQWGIKCDTWAKNGLYYGDATVMDIDTCTTIHPIVGTLGVYYFQYEAINKTNGKKLAVCP